jgi:hypothetical protein
LVRWPGRYADPRGAVMWDRVTKLLAPRWVEGSAVASGLVEGMATASRIVEGSIETAGQAR